MFFPPISQEQMKEAKDISYDTAIKRPDKDRHSICVMTPVKWNKRAEAAAREEVELKTIGRVTIYNKKKITLPYGYCMVYHKSEEDLYNLLYDPEKEYSDEYLDNLCDDVDFLFDHAGIFLGDQIPDDEAHAGYYERKWERESSWTNYNRKVIKLFEEVREWDEEGEPPKHEPPESVIPLIEEMLKLAKESGL